MERDREPLSGNQRVLIANRGVIAWKAAQAIQQMGVNNSHRPHMLFTDAEFFNPHENIWMLSFLRDCGFLGGLHQISNYLNIEEIIKMATKLQVDIVFPGYGFRAEDPNMARACEDAGINWAGPPSEILELFGDKIRARKLAHSLNIPVITGTLDPIDPGNAMQEALKIIKETKGDDSKITPEDWRMYPIRIKSVMAGGGKGQAIAKSPEELISKVELTAEESGRACGDKRIYLERDLPHTRHLEVQIIGDGTKVIHMGARNCSIQIPGRNQKLVEEAVWPGQPFLPQSENEILQKIIGWAVKIGEAVNYKGVGTVEFLVDEVGNIYFLEVNPRIQVEHLVTEIIIRIKGQALNLIVEQLKIAAGAKLDYSQDDISFNGCAMEARIVSMDPEQLTSYPSTIERYRPPWHVGNVVLHDGGLTEAFRSGRVKKYKLPPYDPMFAQMVAWGQNHINAAQSLSEGLKHYYVDGDVTTLNSLVMSVLRSPLYLMAGGSRIFTDFTAEHHDYSISIN